ncbi:hydantoinase/oxoprolinase family protein [Haloferax volcanii]|uniref:N-methylhydantoinase (ATP-hydrolyzing) A n=4 Tax=Haloferax TaxID=2251 RepID=D4GR53_HALVD|nr:hydantoinase/oxoprolinase family protein [Haloferax volcanii]ADE02065.1 N-methylhydantoinase (ATP-hydrolyzing) A [Haloferax volcanii DS2]ELY30781.1 N-methylhydantoinase (ATP-hydrolyzing) A [Haloferax volcanii DS2]MBS8121001.1 hydantoinase/oxoprolinase family protein [Haloferax volcanii]MBS8126038.1 hydantoinase/oxoprolinase family protein [Haloferax volcanii]MBS8129891.1 hydantoinase/oxoprolinase family protein [Haloferax volcanii]
MTQQINRIAIDIGGTFTDLAAVDGGTLELEKTSTTPANFADGVLTAVEKSALDPASLDQFVHGTTVVINAITERAGQETALLTTTGFRDVLDITRANRPDMFNYQYEKPEPFVPRRHRWEVDGRVDQAGSILTPLDEDGVREAAREMRAKGLDTIAVCYVHGYENPEHEQRTRELIEEEYPEAYVTLSHELTKEYREYERTNTTVLNSYVRPIADAYLDNLETQLDDRDLTGSKYAMKSNAGTASFAQARRTPVEMVESGPVGGVYGAAHVGEQIGTPDVISFDMGGTTAKASLVQDGNVTIDTDYWLESSPRDEGYPLKVPVVDIVEIGTGGGSIAWTDPGGSINVGPKSSGADPGPACYGRGGTKPTVTDANLLTGRLNSDYFLGGEMDLNVDAARDAVEPLADKFGTTVEEAAHGVLRVVNSSMSNALKQVSIRRGHDPRDFAMVASGGAGPLHAATLGRELGVDETIIPRAPGQFSAWGMLMTDVRKDFARTHVTSFEVSAIEEVTAAFADLEEDAYAAYEPEAEVDRGDVELERTVDLRYAGQEHTVNVPLTGDAVTPDAVCGTIKRFHKRHDQTYGFRLDDDVEVVNFRLTASVPMPKPEVTTVERNGCPEDAVKETRTVDFGTEGVHNTRVYERDAIPTTTPVTGPAVIEEPACTTLVHPDQAFDVDELGNIHIQ